MACPDSLIRLKFSLGRSIECAFAGRGLLVSSQAQLDWKAPNRPFLCRHLFVCIVIGSRLMIQLTHIWDYHDNNDDTEFGGTGLNCCLILLNSEQL